MITMKYSKDKMKIRGGMYKCLKYMKLVEFDTQFNNE
jgi:hypothetical protein